jgi:predicted nucleotidyltransferase
MLRPPMTSTLPLLHAAFLETLIEKLKLDDRFEALLAGGSVVHGGFDEYSDIDLVPVIRSDAYAQVLTERREIAGGLGNLLSAFTGEHVGEPRLLICLYGPELLHVDLKFAVLSDLKHLVERPKILWARDGTVISNALDAAIIEWPVLGPMLHRRSSRPQRGVRKIELDGEATEALLAVIADHDRKSVSTALMNAARLYLELREDEPPKLITSGMPDLLVSLVATD